MFSRSFRIALTALVLLLGAAEAARAQGAGRIVGRVVDGATGRGLPGATVAVQGVPRQVVAGVDGRFALEGVPAGTHRLAVSLIGYGTKTVTGVQVGAGATVRQDVSLNVASLMLEALVVTSSAERGSVTQALDTQRNATGVVSAIGAEQIARSPDADAAQAVRRVSGVTVQDGRYVVVRGLGERYTNTELNGARLPSPEPERKVVPLDLFPSGIIQDVTTRKTFTPDLAGDFSGALVNIRTREYPTSRQTTISASVGVNDALLGQDILRAPRAGGERFAAVGGDRDPSAPLLAAGDFSQGVSQGELNTIVNSFRNAWSPRDGSGTPSVSLGLSTGGTAGIGGQDVGYLVSGSYANSQELRGEERRAQFEPTDGSPVNEFRTPLGTAVTSVQWGGVANLSTLLGERHRLSTNHVYNRTGDNEARREFGSDENLGIGSLQIDRLRYVERSIRSNQLAGEHQLSDAHRVNWAVTSAGVTRKEPDRSEFYRIVTSDGRSLWNAQDSRAAVRTYGDLDESSLEGSLDYTLSLSGRAGTHELKVGGMMRGTARDAENRSYAVFNFGSDLLTEADRALSAEEIFDGRFASGADDVFTVRPLLQGGSYEAEDRLAAGYAMLDFALTPRIRLIGGARVERSDVEVRTVGQDGSANVTNPTYTDVLPALALNVDLTETQKLRVSVSQTLARPEYRELTPLVGQDVLNGDNTQGNPDLRRTLIWNGDLRWEWYPSNAEVVSVGVFGKRFDDPIERFYRPTSGSPIVSFTNPDRATNYGAEFELRTELGTYAPSLEGLSVNGNLTLIESRIELGAGNDSIRINPDRRMVGQAPYVLNAGVTWAPGEGTRSATLLFNRVGSKVYAAGARGLPDLIEQPRSSLDLSLRFGLPAGVGARVDARNLLDSSFEVRQGDVVREFYRSGRSFSVGLTYRP